MSLALLHCTRDMQDARENKLSYHSISDVSLLHLLVLENFAWILERSGSLFLSHR